MSPLTNQVRSFLENARVGHLATADQNGAPHVVPVCFALLDDETLVFAIDDKPKPAGRTLKRLRNLEENDRFSLVVDRWDEDWRKIGYVLLSGRGRACNDPTRAVAAIGRLRSKYPQYVAMQLDAARHQVIELGVERVHQWGLV